MTPELVDTHCHLDLEPLASTVADVLGRARSAGVTRCVSIGTTVEASRANVALAEGQVGWQLYRIWYETERVHESLDYQTPHQRLTDGATMMQSSFSTEHGTRAIGRRS